MKVIRDAKAMRAWSRAHRSAGRSVGFVPTMGHLHAGHLSLVKAGSVHADVTVTSIYVNPTQFAPHEDFDVYPRDTEGDLEKLRASGCDAVFLPDTLYAGGDASAHHTWVQVNDLSAPLCGASRPTFFRGVATVVCKLFNVVEPDIAIFGQKDYQQLSIITQMVETLDFDIEILGMPIVREPDGLAMSSRNVRLSPEHRERARAVPTSLSLVTQQLEGGQRDVTALEALMVDHISASGGTVDYAHIVCRKTLQRLTQVDRPALAAIAAVYGGVRLIDNREIG
jgi:pantoate--beta-alanine ligase